MPLPAGFWAPQKTGSIRPTRGWAHFYKAPASLQWAHFTAGPEISFRGATTLHIFSENFPNFFKKREYIDLSSGLKKMYFVKILSRIHTNIYENRHCRGNTSSHALGFGPGQISLSKPDMHFIRFYRRNSKFFLPDPAFMAGS